MLINTLTKDEYTMDVATEESLNEILDRYLVHNCHAYSYTWKRLGKPLDMSLNLAENEIPDEYEELLKLGLDGDEYIPVIHLYFNDDLTEAWTSKKKLTRR